MTANSSIEGTLHKWVVALPCFALMTVGFFSADVSHIMNGPAWLLLGLVALDR